MASNPFLLGLTNGAFVIFCLYKKYRLIAFARICLRILRTPPLGSLLCMYTSRTLQLTEEMQQQVYLHKFPSPALKAFDPNLELVHLQHIPQSNKMAARNALVIGSVPATLSLLKLY